MTDFSPAYHEASHAVAAFAYNVPITYVSVREYPDRFGVARFGDSDVDDFQAAVIMVAGHVGERMHLGKDPRPNWFLEDDPDMENAHFFVERAFEDELDGRRTVQLRARSLLRTRWSAVEEIAAGLERGTLLTGEQVEKICQREGVRRQGELTKAEALAKMTPKGRKALGGMIAKDGKTVVEIR